MILATGQWVGLDGLGEDVLAEIRPKAEAAVERTAMFFAGQVQKTLSGKRSGRAYRVGKRGVHIASAPGEAPAVLTGRLRQSIAWTKPTWPDQNTVQSEIGTNVVYARRLEYGGIDSRGVKLAARPYWAPTFLRVQESMARMMEQF